MGLRCADTTRSWVAAPWHGQVAFGNGFEVIVVSWLSLGVRSQRLLLLRVTIRDCLVIAWPQVTLDLGCGSHRLILKAIHRCHRLTLVGLHGMRGDYELRFTQSLFPFVATVADFIDTLAGSWNCQDLALIGSISLNSITLRPSKKLIDMLVQRVFPWENWRYLQSFGAWSVHLGLSTSSLVILNLMRMLTLNWDRSAPIVHLILNPRVRKRWIPRHLLTWLLHHIFTHTNQLLDQELKHSILVLILHFGELL